MAKIFGGDVDIARSDVESGNFAEANKRLKEVVAHIQSGGVDSIKIEFMGWLATKDALRLRVLGYIVELQK